MMSATTWHQYHINHLPNHLAHGTSTTSTTYHMAPVSHQPPITWHHQCPINHLSHGTSATSITYHMAPVPHQSITHSTNATLILGVTTGPNSACMISVKSVPADFGPTLVSLCKKIVRFCHQEQMVSLES